jgi:hypothetical protein
LRIENFMRLPKNAEMTAKSKLNYPQCRRYPPILASQKTTRQHHQVTRKLSQTMFDDLKTTICNNVFVLFRSRFQPPGPRLPPLWPRSWHEKAVFKTQKGRVLPRPLPCSTQVPTQNQPWPMQCLTTIHHGKATEMYFTSRYSSRPQ